MASNSFGQYFRITTWGESHGPAIGVVIDGCPAGIAITLPDIQQALDARAPGQHGLTSPRKEPDRAHIYSGVFEGVTTGTPISIIIYNQDVNSSHYTPIKEVLRPGHAQYTYLEKYGIYDYRGGGRASARETACRVAAGAVAKKVLAGTNIDVKAYLHEVGELKLNTPDFEYLSTSELGCAHQDFEVQLTTLLSSCKQSGNSIGGVVAFQILGVPVGLGDPVYEKLEANLAKAMMGLPASKGFEIGEGFSSAKWSGTDYNDTFDVDNARVVLTSNHAGGTLAGISSGQPITGRVVFKPTSSIQSAQRSVSLLGEKTDFQLPPGSRHDPCVAIRAVPVVAAMCYLVLVDAFLLNKLARLHE